MINIRVKTSSLELEMSDDTSHSLAEVANVFVRVAQSQPVQNSIQSPILLRELQQPREQKQAQLPLFEVTEDRLEHPIETKKKRLSNGSGEEAQAYNKMLEMIPKGFFDSGKNFAEITTALAKVGYNISSKRLADALLRLVREEHLVRDGEKRKYTYKKPDNLTS
jgi:hypothetical protein